MILEGCIEIGYFIGRILAESLFLVEPHDIPVFRASSKLKYVNKYY